MPVGRACVAVGPLRSGVPLCAPRDSMSVGVSIGVSMRRRASMRRAAGVRAAVVRRVLRPRSVPGVTRMACLRRACQDRQRNGYASDRGGRERGCGDVLDLHSELPSSGGQLALSTNDLYVRGPSSGSRI